MRTLCVFQALLGLGAASSGLAGVVMWTEAYSAFLPALWQGLLFLICGWWGFRALGKKNHSNSDMTVAMALTVLSVPVSMALLTQALCNVMAYMPMTQPFFTNSHIGGRSLSLEAIMVDAAMAACACLQVLTATTTVSRMRKVLGRREDESMVRSFYRSPSGPPPQLRLPVTHAWSYAPSGVLENEVPGFDKDKSYHGLYGGNHGYPMPSHLSSPITLQGRDSRCK